MPIRIPRLQQIQPSGNQADNYRIKESVPDQANAILKQTQGVTSLVNQGTDLYTAYEDDKIDQLSNKAELDYNVWNNDQLEKLKSIEGDPTDAYAKYDEEEKKKVDEMIAANPDLSGRVKEHLTSNISKMQDKYRVHVLKQRGAQMETYDNNLYEATVKLKRDNLANNASLIIEGDDSSLTAFRQNLADIELVIAKQAAKKGLATIEKDDQGNIKSMQMNAIAKERLAVEVSKGVGTSIEAMLGSGRKKEAEMMLQKFGDRLLPKDKIPLDKKMEKVELNEKADEKMTEILTKYKNDPMAVINGLSPELKEKTLDKLTAYNSRIAALRKNKEDTNFEALSNAIIDLKSKGKINGFADIESNSQLSTMYDNSSAKQKEAIREEFEAPKVSDQKALGKAYDIVLGLDPNIKIEDIKSTADFQQYTVGLNREDKAKLMTKFSDRLAKKENVHDSDRIYSKAAKQLRTQLFTQEILKTEENGKLSKENTIKLNKANEELLDHLEELGPQPDEKKIKDFVKNYIDTSVKDKIFANKGKGLLSSIGSLFSGGESAPVAKVSKVVTKKENPFDTMDAMKRNKLARQFKIKFGLPADQVPKTDNPLFQEFARENM